MSAFSYMRITILDEIEEQNKVAITWTLIATHEKDFAGTTASHKNIEIERKEILHFEKDKIKEGWTMFNMAELVK
ncbi:MAG TPA: ester cyclase [Nitrososphaeraceae archaeon]|nr:ester cyclase [Nitrososphaeraceae archaeon]